MHPVPEADANADANTDGGAGTLPTTDVRQRRPDGVNVVDAAAPDTATRLLKRGPQPRVGGQRGVRRKVWPWRARGEHPRAFLRAEGCLAFANQINRADQPAAVDGDLDEIAVAHLADRAPCQRLWTDVADAGAGA